MFILFGLSSAVLKDMMLIQEVQIPLKMISSATTWLLFITATRIKRWNINADMCWSFIYSNSRLFIPSFHSGGFSHNISQFCNISEAVPDNLFISGTAKNLSIHELFPLNDYINLFFSTRTFALSSFYEVRYATFAFEIFFALRDMMKMKN